MPEIGSRTEGKRQRFQDTIFLEAVKHAWLHGQAVWEDDSQPRAERIRSPEERRAKNVTLVGYVDDVAMVTVAATIRELEWKCNDTLEIDSSRMKAYGLQLAFLKKLLLFQIFNYKSKNASK